MLSINLLGTRKSVYSQGSLNCFILNSYACLLAFNSALIAALSEFVSCLILFSGENRVSSRIVAFVVCSAA